MRALNRISHSLLALIALVVLASAAFAQGNPIDTPTVVSDQLGGSVLVYPLITSSATGAPDDTTIQLTNTNSAFGIAVHLFSVDGATCNITDIAVCLTKNQTICFRASELDPGVTGFLIAIASNPFTGCPIGFNSLIGDEFVRITTGGTTFQAQLAAESFGTSSGGLGRRIGICDLGNGFATICFNTLDLNLGGRVLAASSVLSPADASTLVVINRLQGNLLTGSGFGTGNVFALLFDDRENSISFSIPGGVCQTRAVISAATFRGGLVGRFLPAGTCGWLKVFATSEIAITGAVLTSSATARLNGGTNLHKLTSSGGLPFVTSTGQPLMGDAAGRSGPCLVVPVFQICDDAPFAGTE